MQKSNKSFVILHTHSHFCVCVCGYKDKKWESLPAYKGGNICKTN